MIRIEITIGRSVALPASADAAATDPAFRFGAPRPVARMVLAFQSTPGKIDKPTPLA